MVLSAAMATGLLAGAALGHDGNSVHYVRVDGSDSNDGHTDSAGGAWLTINKALSALTAGDEARVQPGTYHAATYHHYTGSANGIVIRRNGDSGVVLLTSGGDRILRTDPASSGAVTFEYITFDDADCTYVLTPKGATSLTFNHCTFGASGDMAAHGFFRGEDATSNTTRHYTFHNCTIHSRGAGHLIEAYNMGIGKLVFSGCTVHLGSGLNLVWNNSATGFEVVNCTIHQSTTVTGRVIVGTSTNADIGYTRVTGNVINLAGAETNCGVISLASGCGDAMVVDNLLNIGSSANGCVGIQFGVDGTSEPARPPGLCICVRNTVRYTGTGISHGILFGTGANGGVCSFNTIAGGDYGIVVKGNDSAFAHNVVYGSGAGYAAAVYVRGGDRNRFTFNTLYNGSPANFETIRIDSHATGYEAYRNVFTDNIIVAAGGVNHAVHDCQTTERGQVFDRNCYWGGDAGVMYLSWKSGAENRQHIADVRSAWSGLGGFNAANDANSIEADPQFVNAAGGDFRIGFGSPCAGTPSWFWRDLGAWQRRVRKPAGPVQE